ncbi:dTDP-4-dehydrorhamnose reductase [Paenibacillus hunanensis]|uniref:dTDP-4-dehydrorhamnose reductase n=1 Tax=Paenibacillus hunanensis TaxID=539262 RepID=A0ABU1IV49_9BACL|nr:dTDP-4-dehydrorhamnose reductase [Paenibacillus hunanensis]MDR6242542.1 dTDP-4-dehydrorhamnose reductase [Paenibacillus hunanensis]GGJ00836.1 NAD(P)-dependent oxidoreductase [Paenibacillus hunanensis]
MKVLVTGASGQLGMDMVAVLHRKGHDVMGCNRQQLDITNLEQCQQVVGEFAPAVIVHCAAYTAVDAAETDVDGAYLVNATGSRNMAVAAEAVGAKIIYVSTDYVFDGQGESPYYEYDNTDPQGIYGKSKRAGEQLTQTLSSRYFIVRTSWVYGLHGNNFVKTMLKLGQEKPELKVVHDQKGTPTYTVDLAEFVSELMLTEKYGIYHASNSGACTWYEFTQEIFSQAKQVLEASITASLEPCTTADFPRPAPRPANSVMEHMSIRTNGFQDIRDWREGLTAFLQEYKVAQSDIK